MYQTSGLYVKKNFLFQKKNFSKKFVLPQRPLYIILYYIDPYSFLNSIIPDIVKFRHSNLFLAFKKLTIKFPKRGVVISGSAQYF